MNILITFGLAQINAQAASKPFVLYGHDNRSEYFEIADPKIRHLADSTVTLVEREYITTQPGAEIAYGQAESWAKNENLCPNEKYGSQPALGFCSGSLIAPDLILTAGHCFDNELSCKKTSFVFDYRRNLEGEPTDTPLLLRRQNMYSCKKLVYRANAYSNDFAVVQLDRPVLDRDPLVMTQNKVNKTTQVFILGYPMGIPLKYAGNSSIRTVRSHSFLTDLDAFGGNSGSPVFSHDTNEILGILVSGEEDTVYDQSARCHRVLRCAETGCRGETVMKISVLRKNLGI